MKTLFTALVFLSPLLSFAELSEIDWARQQTGITDPRLVPSMCQSSGGSIEFAKPTRKTTFNCLTSIEGSKKDMAYILTNGKKITQAYRISDCDVGTGLADGQYLHREQTCAIREMDVETLQESGRASKLKMVSEADPSGMNIYLSFRLNGENVKDLVSPLNELRGDY